MSVKEKFKQIGLVASGLVGRLKDGLKRSKSRSNASSDSTTSFDTGAPTTDFQGTTRLDITAATAESGASGALKRLRRKEPKPMPVIGKYPQATQVLITVSGAALFLSLAAAIAFFAINRAGYLQELTDDATGLQADSQRLSTSLGAAARGEPQAFSDVDATSNQIESHLVELVSGAGQEAIANGPAKEYVDDLVQIWGAQKEALKPLLQGSRKYMSQLTANRSKVQATYQKATESAERAYSMATQLGYSGDVLSSLGSSVKSLSSLNANFVALATSPTITAAQVQQVEADQKILVASVAEANRAIAAKRVSGSAASEMRLGMAELGADLAELDGLVSEVSINLKSVIAGKEAASKAINQSADLYIAALSVKTVHLDELRALYVYYVVAGVSGFIGLLFAFLTLGVTNREASRLAYKNELEVQTNEQAIENISEGLVAVTNGDFTARIRVDEALFGTVVHKLNKVFTKTIAKALGQAKATAGSVAGRTQTATQSAQKLTHYAQTQSAKAVEASSLVERMVDGSRSVAAAAHETASTAEKSLFTVKEGAAAVESTQASMTLVADKQQRQAKLVKRLGERSQEVTLIAERLSRVAEGAKVLSINASIQAEQAGEHGRGFGVVAEEMKRLADVITQELGTVMSISANTQNDAREALEATDDAVAAVVQAKEASEVSQTALSAIAEATHTTQRYVAQIERLSDQQLNDAESARQRMAEVSALSESTKVAADEMASISEGIRADAEALAQELAKYKTEAPRGGNVVAMRSSNDTCFAAAAE